jgi:hypothetical protein
MMYQLGHEPRHPEALRRETMSHEELRYPAPEPERADAQTSRQPWGAILPSAHILRNVVSGRRLAGPDR